MFEKQFAQALDKHAELAVRVGLNLQPGQNLIITAPAEALPLVRRIVKAAYKAGAGLVTPILSDEDVTLARFENAADESFDKAPDWLYEGMARAYSQNTARLAITRDDPTLLSQSDPAKVARANRANVTAYKPALKFISEFAINWTIVSYPTLGWAKAVFPDLDDDAAVEKLANAIYAASRVDVNDPVLAWQEHNANLAMRAQWLNEQDFDALHFKSAITDLTVGLAEEHEWVGGATRAKNGVVCNPNIPTEEVFTTPHAQKVDGTVRSTKPLAHQGTLIEDIEVRFEGGKIVEASAKKGNEVFQKLIDTDEGARRLGEVALVPHSSPISQTGILFLDTMYDENAACHIALGQCYSKCFKGGDKISEEAVTAQGGNASLIHVDWMIGSADMDIDGISKSGERVPVFRKGEWAN